MSICSDIELSFLEIWWHQQVPLSNYLFKDDESDAIESLNVKQEHEYWRINDL